MRDAITRWLRRYVRLNAAIWDALVYSNPFARYMGWLGVAAIWVLFVWLVWP